MGGVVILDEAEANIHDLLFQKLLEEIRPILKGQVIMTTHNTMLMEASFAREATYILSVDPDNPSDKKNTMHIGLPQANVCGQIISGISISTVNMAECQSSTNRISRVDRKNLQRVKITA